jgi:Kef-type K+ transport system membrane component KefB
MPHLPADFFLQMAVILLACRLAGMIAKKIGQPQVVGEMIAGVVLGPSVLGHFFPEQMAVIFTPASRGVLEVGAQLGVGLYMFLVGMEFDGSHFKGRMRSAVSVSLAGMLVPFVLGAALAPWLMKVPGIFSSKVTPMAAMMFLGASIAITAFPMLARIISERGLSGTPLGTLALAAGAIDDAAAWCVLAIVLAYFGNTPELAYKAIGGGIAYAIFMLTLGKRLLAYLKRPVERAGHLTPAVMAIILMLFCLGAWFTDFIGIHAVFGGFIMGIAMPRGLLVEDFRKRVEPFAVVFLLPMFFTFSGLKTRLDVMIQEPQLIIAAVVILLASILGKGVACWAAARTNGEDNRTALAVGSLMNARGLMELIIINIGLSHGVIQQGLFSILVVMAIVTTLMATPIFEFVYGRHVRKPGSTDEESLTEV